MSANKLYKIYIYLLIYIALVSPAQWCSIPLGNTFISWAVSFFIVYFTIKINKKFNPEFDSRNYLIVRFYLIWTAICSIRGLFVADNYWEFKNLIEGTLTCLLPMFVYVFCNPELTAAFYRKWIKFCLPLFFLFYIWTVTPGEVNFYLAPLFILGCFIPLMPTRYKIVTIFCLGFMLVADLGGRSQVLKAFVALLFSFVCLKPKIMSDKIIKIVHWGGYSVTIFLLVLGLSGQFNVFEDFSSNQGKYVERRMVDGALVESDLSDDTRTFIYIEVLESAIRNGYLVWGRTPARGNDSVAFGTYSAEELKTGKYERHSNELLHLNLLTWIGLVGMLMYSFIYLRSSYLAVYRSNSKYLKYIGLFIVFHWSYGWVEDFNRFDIQNIALWSVIAIGLSSKFRAMSDAEFQYWVRGIFGRPYKLKT